VIFTTVIVTWWLRSDEEPFNYLKGGLDMKTKTDVTVKLIGEDGNAFAILGTVSRALKRAGYQKEAKEYMAEAMSGDYDHLLQVTMEYVNVA
jgi:hypothetical protein